MCGLAGQVSSHQSTADAVRRMVDGQTHRGPDSSAVRQWRQCVLSHKRLRIVDLSPGADQPMANEDESVWVVFNSEIYNFTELRVELKATGHRFRTHTDTEVLVHLYEEHGPALVERLRGIFAFAIWDDRAQRLQLARDRLGIKPLYYRREGAGHLLGWSDGQVRLRRWWQPPHRVASGVETDGEPLADVLADAFRRHLVADVPVGLFLSPGVYSLALAYLAARAGADLTGHTVAFDTGPGEAREAAA